MNALIKLIILVFLLSLIYTAVTSILKGVADGVKSATSVLKGESVEEVKKKEQEEFQKRKKLEEERMKSSFYKITHPLLFLNYKAEKQIKKQIGSQNDEKTR